MDKINFLSKKIMTFEELRHMVKIWRFKGHKLVFTNGCFDILHYGHVEYLTKASQLGNILIIGLNTDASVRKIKGDSRPVQDERTRAYCLAAFHFTDAVVLFNEETPYELIATIKPDFLVKGSDYHPENIVGYDIVTSSGGKIETIDFAEGYSTSSVIQKILNTRQ
ncbi:MAG: D-glycero-beta-D-manno-heptose 1-phosphate adenylyltransferase [Bacteroidia bacterium]|nr:D-glycero-beta-D-manno-heptose 1-phosphate adenylyltransferase [Bacteroidia bacterium]